MLFLTLIKTSTSFEFRSQSICNSSGIHGQKVGCGQIEWELYKVCVPVMLWYGQPKA